MRVTEKLVILFGLVAPLGIAGDTKSARFYLNARTPASVFDCWEETKGGQPVKHSAAIPKCPTVGVYDEWKAGRDFVEAGEIVEVRLSNTEDQYTYSAVVSDKAVDELPAIRGGTPGGKLAGNIPSVTLFLGVWSGSTIVKVQINKTLRKCDQLPEVEREAAKKGGLCGDDPKPELIFSDSFTVHRFYHANIVGGFMMSTLRNREYGATSTQQTTSAGAATTVITPVVGPIHRPQLHAFVGVAWYFKNQDFFPGAEAKWRPAVFFGSVADETQSYMAGLQIEPLRGFVIGGGAHFGKESFLASGIVAGVDGTRLSDVTKPPPTVTRSRGGAYFSLGFDLSLFKAVFGGAAGLK